MCRFQLHEMIQLKRLKQSTRTLASYFNQQSLYNVSNSACRVCIIACRPTGNIWLAYSQSGFLLLLIFFIVSGNWEWLSRRFFGQKFAGLFVSYKYYNTSNTWLISLLCQSNLVSYNFTNSNKTHGGNIPRVKVWLRPSVYFYYSSHCTALSRVKKVGPTSCLLMNIKSRFDVQ